MDKLSRHACCFSSLVLAPLQVARAPRLVGSVSRCRLPVLPRLGLGTLLGRLCLASAWFGFGLGLGLGFGFEPCCVDLKALETKLSRIMKAHEPSVSIAWVGLGLG